MVIGLVTAINNIGHFAHNNIKKYLDGREKIIMSKNAVTLLVVSTLYSFAMGLSNIFINVFFWRETNNFIVVATYNLIIHIVTPIMFIFAGMLSKRKNGIWSMRLGLLIYSLFFSLILLIGNKGIIYIYLLGMVCGIAAGFYWLAFNTVCFDITDSSFRDTFNGFNGCLSGIATIIGPITAAFIISRFKGFTGYRIVFSITLIIFILLIFISAKFSCKSYSDKLNFSVVFHGNNSEWNTVAKSTFVWGFRDATIILVVNIMIIEILKSELTLGVFILIASLTSAGSFILVQKIIKPRKRKLSILIGTTGSFIAVWALIIKTSYISLFIYTVIEAFFLPFYMVQLSSATFNVINQAHEEKLRIEYMINRDIVLNSGRIISTALLIFMLIVFKNSQALKLYLVLMGVSSLAAGHFLKKLKYIDQ